MDTLISNVTLVTMNEKTDVLFGAYLGIADGKIAYIGKTAPQEQPKTIIDGTGMVAMPGLINCHTHLPTSILRNFLDDATKAVTVEGEPVSLTPTEYAILHLLMKNPGRVYSTKKLYEAVWQEAALGSEGAVAVHIRHLREKIEINPSEPRYIKVVWGQGYKMEGGR